MTRFLIVEHSRTGHFLIVSHTDRQDKIRIISARKLSKRERKFFEGAEMTRKDMRSEYDFSQLGDPIRGKYAEAFKNGSNLVLLDANDALRLLMNLAKKQMGQATPET